MMPEQVWDDADIPGRGLHFGGPAGAATPLVWAHAEYLKLLRSARDGQVFDRVDPVYERYCTDKGLRPRRNLEIFTFQRPIQRIRIGETLRIIDPNRFEIKWSFNDWKSFEIKASASACSAGFWVDIPIPNPDGTSGKISWTLTWTDTGKWLGYNVDEQIVPYNLSD